jgi:UDP-N-acetylmuramate--alanine ligase
MLSQWQVIRTPTDAIAKAIASFKGIKRRFSYQIKTDVKVYIDDYAHHPTEINAVHQAVRELYPNQKFIFQPHLFSREILLMILPKVYRL